jgi:uncharacterized membrane protein YfcA
MTFVKEQREGLARFLDTIAAAAFIGAVVGATGHSLISGAEIASLFFWCLVIISASFQLRKPS